MRSRIALGLTFVVIAAFTACSRSPAGQFTATRYGADSFLGLGSQSTSTGALLYVASGRYGIFVLTYPGLSPVTSFALPGDAGPNGSCSDASGNVFITAGDLVSGDAIYGYAHGTTSPFTTLDDSGYLPLSCAVDPTTGNLAVVNAQHGYGKNIAIWQGASGTPTYYTAPNMREYYYCAYDSAGNLFVDGPNNNQPKLAELPKGSDTFFDITLNRNVHQPGSLQWYGNYLAMGSHGKIYHVKITGASGKAKAKTAAIGLENPWLIIGQTLISPHAPSRCGKCAGSRLAFWNYPSGGDPTEYLDVFGSDAELVGLALSPAAGR